MYRIYSSGGTDPDTVLMFGEKYELTDETDQANIIMSYDGIITGGMLAAKLVFAVVDLSENGLTDDSVDCCSEHGTVVFRAGYDAGRNGSQKAEELRPVIETVRDFIENGNISSSVNFPDVALGPFGDDVSRLIVLTDGIDAPILLGAMMENSMDLRAIAGGTKEKLGAALIAGREPVTRVPHFDGVIKVRVLQDI